MGPNELHLTLTDNERGVLLAALWDRISRIDRRNDELADSGMEWNEILQRRGHLSDEVFALIKKVEAV